MKGKFWFILLVIIMVVLVAACSPEPPPEPTATPVPTVHPGKAIVKSRCISCHDIGRVTNYKSDVDGWKLTVDRMILLGATLSDEQRDSAVDYLAFAYPKE